MSLAMSLFKITPEYLTDYVNFHFTDKKWKYQKSEKLNIAKLQAEGAAKIYNLLLSNQIALLSDEVGMGKTYEALAVMVSLWRQKPTAKILLYAPNEIVALKWLNDYNNFIRNNFKEEDDLVKSSLNGEPLHKAVYCRNQIELMEQINKKWGSFFVCKTSSLSGFYSPKMNNETFEALGVNITRNIDESSIDDAEKAKWMINLAKEFNNKAYQKLSENENPPFDLLVFDEAHYLRRTEITSTSNRSLVAHAFFSGRNIKENNPFAEYRPIASKVLLMTATPTHSSNEDVRTIVSLFNPDFREKGPEEILRRICVRRFRRLEDKIKYHYRKEIPEGVEMKKLKEKLFFAAYQKSLVLHKAKAAKEGKMNGTNPYRILFGYLEGFEFISDKGKRPVKKEEQDTEKQGVDFDENEDTQIIEELSEKYQKAYKKRPSHPKYDKTIKDLLPPSDKMGNAEKKLVFVRRIPSVNEISSRLVNEYDKKFRQYLKQVLRAIGKEKVSQNNLRKVFYNLGRNENVLDTDDAELEKEEVVSGVPKSKILDLFTVKKEGKYRTTDCSNFRLRFVKDEQIFSVFFQPAVDYKSEKYVIDGFLLKEQNDRKRRLFRSTVKIYRKENIEEYQERIKLGIKEGVSELVNVDNTYELGTLIGIWYRHSCNHSDCIAAKKEYESFTITEKEGFSNYLEAGILFSSQYIVIFYSYYYPLRRLQGRKLYQKFCKKVANEADKIGLITLITKAVLSFRQFYKKELGLTENRLLNEKNWNFLKSTIPVYPYNGITKRPSIVKAFNTPFYPNALIATSVLQEGVDLHYHCSNVIHYGIAWTPGDNEQRNGRVDRLFGKLHHDLKLNPEKATFPIRYPYLKNTLDQYQLKRFIKRKFYSEKLLDNLKITNTSKEVNFQEKIEDDWEKYFNKPNGQQKIIEPYSVKDSDFEGIDLQFGISKDKKILAFKNALEAIFNTVKKEYGKEVLYFQFKNTEKVSSLICAIKHVRPDNGRHQPVLIELNYFEPGLSWIGTPTYLLKIKTPLGECDKGLLNNGLPDELKEAYQDNPILKINYSPVTKGLFRYYISSELPVFIHDNNATNLSGKELITAIENVIKFADDLENTLFLGEKDIKNEEVIKDKEEKPEIENINTLGEDRKPINEIEGWEVNNSEQYYYQKKKDGIFNDWQDIYLFNAQNNLIRKIDINGIACFQVGLYKNDALDKELMLMEKIIENIND